MTKHQTDPLPNIRAVVFDMDGLMFNTEDLYDLVGQAILQRRGHQYTRELKLKMMGLPGNAAFQVMKDEFGLSDSIDALQRETHEEFVDLLPRDIKKMPGLDSLLQFLESKSIPKAIATSSSPGFAAKALGAFDLASRFEFILTSADVEKGKPDPEVYLLAAKKLAISPTNMLVLEDSLTGSRAAVAAGAFTVAVPTHHTADQDYSHVHQRVDSLGAEFIHELFS